MKRLTALCLALVLLASLPACGSQPQETPPAPEPEESVLVTDDPNLGRYTCTAVSMDGMDLGPDGQWLELEPNGKAVLFLVGEPDEARWTLSGTTFTLTMGGETVATGTLVEGTLTADLMGMACTFVKEGASSAQEPTPTEPAQTEYTPKMGSFSCQGLYAVTYPLDRFQESEDNLTDLISTTGAKVWFTKLDTKAAADQWRADFETKTASESVLQWEGFELTAGEYPAEAVVYEEADGWHAAVLVDFGRNRGTDGQAMTAACLYLSGPTREDVWNDDVQSMVSSLRLGQ